MHGIITEYGGLQIERAGKFKPQACIHAPEIHCGDWCPLFNERQTGPGERMFVAISCGGSDVFVAIDKDERKAES